MEIQLSDKTYHFDEHLSLRWKFISLMKMYQSDETYHMNDLRSPCWPIKFSLLGLVVFGHLNCGDHYLCDEDLAGWWNSLL